MELPIIMVGGGGHARVLIATLLMQGREVIGFVDPATSNKWIYGVRHLGDDSVIRRHGARNIQLVNGVGSTGSGMLRCRLFRKFRKQGFRFTGLVHPTAILANDVRLGEGVQIMAGVVIQPGSCVGANGIVNTGALIDHDCNIGAHAHIAPGAALSGQVRVGIGAHIGTGATVIQSVRVGAWSIVGAGAAVIRDVPAGVTAVGVPAKWQATKAK
jgi:sugar O-acyltransferase (sialic acid O-acetyltransferase NeuD family)